MKKNVFAKTGIVIVIAAVIIGFCMWLFSGAGGNYYYTQIDNNKIEKGGPRDGVIDLETGGMPYSYTLLAYNENGGEKEITFGASRALREGAFLRLTVSPVRGVIEWSELQYDELPMAVQNCYVNPKDESNEANSVSIVKP